jgi:hypothetical protein
MATQERSAARHADGAQLERSLPGTAGSDSGAASPIPTLLSFSFPTAKNPNR